MPAWCLAIDHAVHTGQLDVRIGLPHVDPRWTALLEAAEAGEPTASPITAGSSQPCKSPGPLWTA